ncbi:MAG TPA: chloride channel protein, partial [Acidimicrobiales bacterium]|nr:chloride channel protein [Acidimicrobiales bacterium]
LLVKAFPGIGISPSAFALVAMAATFGAAARAPFAAIVFLFELTRDYNAMLPLMLAAVLADLVARTLLEQSIMTEKLARRGIAVPSAFHVDPLRTSTVAEVVNTDVVTVPSGAPPCRTTDTLHAALNRMTEESVDHLSVVNGSGVLVGTVTRADILRVRFRQQDLERREHGWLTRRRAAAPRVTGP